MALPYIKENIRAIGIDDGYFKPRTKGSTKIVAVLLRADCRLEGILCEEITIDGLDSTARITKMLKQNEEKFLKQASVLFLDGVNFAGFNIVDVDALHSALKLPIIIVFRRMPKMREIFAALERFEDRNLRMRLIKKAGEIHKADKIFFQCRGVEASTAKQLIKKFSIHSHLPEPVRIAHLIASAVTLGRSTTP
ncbi:MAG: DUF99 family protein [Candidatus Diapherotrites archaeon]|nr:DUF99 family protein [Candidatus Diapherotrites archaeon]